VLTLIILVLTTILVLTILFVLVFDLFILKSLLISLVATIGLRGSGSRPTSGHRDRAPLVPPPNVAADDSGASGLHCHALQFRV